jgi:outer membrane protein
LFFKKTTWVPAFAGTTIFLLLSAVAHAQQRIQVDVIPSFVGAGVGVTTEWMGAKESVTGIAPAGRVALEDNRFVEVYGTFFDANLLSSPHWELGPVAMYRFGREGVSDPVVNLLPPIDGGFEAGVFVGWRYLQVEGIPYRVRVGVSLTTGVSGGATGAQLSPYVSLWVPLSHTVFVGLGGGFTWASKSFMQQTFGVSPQASAASGLPAYDAGAGVRQYYVWPAVVWKLSREWYVGAGGFLQRITGDGADSPIVTQRGDRNQVTAGLGVGYAW